MFARLLGCALLAVALSACVSSPSSVSPLTSADNGYLASPGERKLIGQADEFHQELVKQGLLVTDTAANDYLNRVGRHLLPAVHGGPTLHYYILKDASINAMALPNGDIYVNVGLIERLESEDQLALVLAHETAHVVQRHSYKGQLDRHNTVVAAHVTDLLLAGTGLAYIPFAMNLASFSREQEQQADLYGLDYMVGKGYDLEQSLQVFDKLEEVKHGDRSSSVWSDHPGLKARKQYSEQKIAGLPPTSGTAVAPAEYVAFRNKLAVLAIQLRLLNGQYELAGDAIDFEIHKQGDAPQWHVLKGDTLREAAVRPEAAAQEYAYLYDKTLNDDLKKKFRNQAPLKFQEAVEQYQAALKLDANTPRALRGIGLVAYQQGDNPKARDYLQRYLADGKPDDRRYIESLLRRMQQ